MPPPPGPPGSEPPPGPPPMEGESLVPASAHPLYQQFFHKLAMREPLGEIQMEMESIGLNASLLDEPDRLIPL